MNKKQLNDLIIEYESNQLIMADLLYLKAHDMYNIDRKVFNVYLARVTKSGFIERLQRGIYFRTNNTKLGKTRPNLFNETIKLYTQANSGFFGYETMLNLLGIRDEIPRKLTIYTINPKRTKYTDNNIILKRIHFELNENNIKYIQILYLLNDIEDLPVNYDILYSKLADYILKNDMRFETFFDYLIHFKVKLLRHFIPLKSELNNLNKV